MGRLLQPYRQGSGSVLVAVLLDSAEDPDGKGNQLAQLLKFFRCDPRSGNGLDPLLGDAAES
jgi:hypothetical protein